MGNRAVLAFGEGPNATGIYLHWNGGRESVQAFLDYANEVGVRTDDYAVARLCQIIGNFFEGTLSVGCGPVATLDTDNGDNGTYFVGDVDGKLAIVGRRYAKDYPFDEQYHQDVLTGVRLANVHHFGGADAEVGK